MLNIMIYLETLILQEADNGLKLLKPICRSKFAELLYLLYKFQITEIT